MSSGNVVLCTEYRNVLRWVEHARSHSPLSNRILRSMNHFSICHGVDVLPVYLRGERNAFADGLARWPQSELGDWAPREDMAEVDAVTRLWAGMALSYNPSRSAS